MLAKTFPVPHTADPTTAANQLGKDLQSWLSSQGPIDICHTNHVDYVLIVFYVELTGESESSRPPIKRPDPPPTHKRIGTRGVWFDGPKCSECGTVMGAKANRATGELFWGCPKYPSCRGAKPFSDADNKTLDGPGPTKPPSDDDIPF